MGKFTDEVGSKFPCCLSKELLVTSSQERFLRPCLPLDWCHFLGRDLALRYTSTPQKELPRYLISTSRSEGDLVPSSCVLQTGCSPELNDIEL